MNQPGHTNYTLFGKRKMKPEPLSESVKTCPECDESTYHERVIESGESFHQEFGKYYWWNIEAKCSNCGHKDSYSDSSI